MPFFLLLLFFLFSPLSWKNKGIGFGIGALLLYGLVLLKLRGMLRFEIAQIYETDQVAGWIKMIPFFSSPGLVFLLVILIWLALFLPLLDKKRFNAFFS